jgi:hypothetical protein
MQLSPEPCTCESAQIKPNSQGASTQLRRRDVQLLDPNMLRALSWSTRCGLFSLSSLDLGPRKASPPVREMVATK